MDENTVTSSENATTPNENITSNETPNTSSTNNQTQANIDYNTLQQSIEHWLINYIGVPQSHIDSFKYIMFE